jgi:flagellar biosynthetic protein FlhB
VAEDDQSQKTEEPTHRRLEKAFEEGSVPKSAEVTSWCLLAAATAIVAFGYSPLFDALSSGMIGFVERPHEINLDGRGAEGVAANVSLLLLQALAVPTGILIFGALAGHLLQHRVTWSTSPLEMKLDKISPMKGFGRIFGPQGWINLVRSLVKLAAVGAAAWFAFWPERGRLETFLHSDPVAILPGVQILALKVLGAILAALAVIALADLLYQRFSHRQRLRMSKQEVKDEHKDMEGDPKIKMKIRQVRAERARRRMMAAIPEATVVVTNPTHYSVALKYVDGETAAPICLAKGVDELALRIRLAAKDHGIPIVENPPLARALHASVEIDEAIPQEHYKAVAEVISFVLKLKTRGRTPPRRSTRPLN